VSVDRNDEHKYAGSLFSGGPGDAGSSLFAPAMNNFHHAGAFVVQFRTGTDFAHGRVEGRVEHIASGRIAHFTSIEELCEAFAQSSESAPAHHPKSDEKNAAG
jgi:hypothetical protein